MIALHWIHDALTVHAMIVVQIACAFYLTGLVWTVQLAHYPAFASVDRERFADFHVAHSKALSRLAGAPMLIELATSLGLAVTMDIPWVVNCVSVLVPFVSTFALSVPCHDELGRGFDERIALRLVRTNWVRTAAWSLRSVGWLVYLFHSNLS